MLATLAQALSHRGLCATRGHGRFLLSVLLLVGSALSFSSCNGLFDGIYDHPSADSSEHNMGFVAYDATTHRGRILVDVGQRWRFPQSSLESGMRNRPSAISMSRGRLPIGPIVSSRPTQCLVPKTGRLPFITTT